MWSLSSLPNRPGPFAPSVALVAPRQHCIPQSSPHCAVPGAARTFPSPRPPDLALWLLRFQRTVRLRSLRNIPSHPGPIARTVYSGLRGIPASEYRACFMNWRRKTKRCTEAGWESSGDVGPFWFWMIHKGMWYCHWFLITPRVRCKRGISKGHSDNYIIG